MHLAGHMRRERREKRSLLMASTIGFGFGPPSLLLGMPTRLHSVTGERNKNEKHPSLRSDKLAIIAQYCRNVLRNCLARSKLCHEQHGNKEKKIFLYTMRTKAKKNWHPEVTFSSSFLRSARTEPLWDACVLGQVGRKEGGLAVVL